MVRGIGKQDANRFKTSNGGKGFTEIDTFDLRKPLGHQSCLFVNENAIFVLLVLEHPLGANNILAILGSSNKRSNLVALEVVEFIMHGLKPILIFEGFINFMGSMKETKA